MAKQSSELTIYKDASSQLRSLNKEFIDLGQKSLALALVMGELLKAERKKYPARGGWFKYLDEIGIHRTSATKYIHLWERRSILPLGGSDGKVGYEVHHVRVADAGEFRGKVLPEREVLATNREWGEFGWSYLLTDYKGALKKFNSITP
jgi:hypothetical protein